MTDLARKFTAAAAAISLIAVPTVASAATSVTAPPAAPQAASAPTASPWLTLSAMTGSSSAASAALEDDGGFAFPPWPALGVILVTVALAIWILASDDDDDSDFVDLPEPISP